MRRRGFLIGTVLGTALSGPALAAAPKTKANPPAPAAKPKQIVALDAGHGGRDPGTIGVAGTYEKDVTLAVTRDLAKRLEATGRYQVLLTRSDDSFIALPDRVRLGRAARAGLF